MNEGIKHRLKIVKRNDLEVYLICYKNGIVRISFQIPKELFDENNMFEYRDKYLEVTVEKVSEQEQCFPNHKYRNVKNNEI